MSFDGSAKHTVRARGFRPEPPVRLRASYALMHVERLDIAGFRNCCESVKLDPALTLILGENNAGKTNVIDA